MGLVLFETTESVIEVLWDVVLAFFVARLAFFYFFSVFLTWLLLITIINTWAFSPQSSMTAEELQPYIASMLVILTACWSRFLITHFEIPRLALFRASIGIAAACLFAGAELLFESMVYWFGRGSWTLRADAKTVYYFEGFLVVYSLMPLIMMYFEHPQAWSDTSHGHEKKSLIDAIPIPNVRNKDTERKKSQ